MIDTRAKPDSKMLLVTSARTRIVVISSIVITMAIIYWLIDLRARALDITFERIFLGLFMFYDYWLALAMFVVLLLALIGPLGIFALRCCEFVGKHVWAVSAMYGVFVCCGALIVYQAHPLSMDEYAAFFQSQVFASGRLAGQFPLQLIDWLIPPGFQNYFFYVSETDGRVVSAYWPAFSLVLAPFTFAGIPWLCNASLGSISVLLTHRLVVKLGGDNRAAGLAALLVIASAAVGINAMSFYSMTAHLVFNAAFALLLFEPTIRRALVAGFLGSIALSLHNPVPHALFAAPWIVWLLATGRWRTLGALCAGYIPLALLMGVGWVVYTSAFKATMIQAHASLLEAWVIRLSGIFRFPDSDLLYARLIGVAKLWIWAVPASVVAALVGGWRLRSDHRVILLAASALATLVGYLMVPFDQGHGWGYRYFHSAWFVVPVLAAGGTFVLANDSVSGISEGRALARYLAACALLSLSFILPLSAFQVRYFIATQLKQVPSAERGTPKVALIHTEVGYYASDLVQNDPYAQNGFLILYSHGKTLDGQMLKRNFPELSLLSRDSRGSVWGIPEGQSVPASLPAENHIQEERTK